MSRKSDRRRVYIAITDTSPVSELWRAAEEHLSGAEADLVAVYVTDDRWRRAATLSFTREISRLGGQTVDFTPQRAEQVDRESVEPVRSRIKELAAASDTELAFEVLPEHDVSAIERLFAVEGERVLIAPSYIASRPIYKEIVRFNCQIRLVEAVEGPDSEAGPGQDTSG